MRKKKILIYYYSLQFTDLSQYFQTSFCLSFGLFNAFLYRKGFICSVLPAYFYWLFYPF